MFYVGDYLRGRPVFIYFNTFDSNDPQASVTMTTFINTDVHIHKDDDLTQRNNAAGITVDVDVDGIAGSHFIKIDTSDETVDNFFEQGHDYFVRIEGATVDAGNINAVVGHFSIENRYHPSERTPEYSVSSDWELNEPTGLSGPGMLVGPLDDRGYGAIFSWELDEISSIFGSSTDNPANGVNIDSVSRDYTSANNLELQYDTTGLSGDTFPASQGQLGNLVSVGAAVNTAAESYTLTTGTQSANTYTATAPLDGTRHEHTDTAGAMELYYQFDIGGDGIPTVATMVGYLTGGNDSLDVFAYDWGGTAWDQIGTLQGGAASDDTHTYALYTSHVGTGANLGKVRIRFYAASGLTSATLAVDQLYVSYAIATRSVGYALGAIWINTGASNTNTENYVDGVADNPVSTIAAANTLSTNLGLDRFQIAPGSTITLAQGYTDYIFAGHGWTLALGGQAIDGSHFFECTISGTATASTEPDFHGCHVGTCTLPPSHLYECSLSATVTVGSAGDFIFSDCYSEVAGASAPTINLAAVGATNISLRRWSGGLNLTNVAAGDVISVDVVSGGTIDVNGTGGTVIIRGICDVTDSSGGSVTITETSVVNRTDFNVSNLDAAISGLNDLSAAQVNAEVVDALATDTYAEPGQGAPAATASIVAKINYLYKAWRNKSTQTATEYNLFDDAGTTVDQKSTDSDNGTTATKGEVIGGP